MPRSNLKKSLHGIYVLNFSVFIMFGLIILLEGKILIALLALKSLLMLLIADKLDDEAINLLANFIFFLILLWMINRVFFIEARGLVILNRRTLFDFFIIIAGILLAILNKSRLIKYSYKLFFGQIAIFALLWRDLSQVSYQLLLSVFILVAVISKIIALRTKDKALKLSTDFVLCILSLVIFIRVLIMIGFQLLSSGFIVRVPFLNLTTAIDLFFISVILIISLFVDAEKVLVFLQSISILIIFGILFRELYYFGFLAIVVAWFLEGILIFVLANRRKINYLKFQSYLIILASILLMIFKIINLVFS